MERSMEKPLIQLRVSDLGVSERNGECHSVDDCHAHVRYCDGWTLNAPLTRSSSYRKCLKRRILGHSAQATSLLPIAGTTKCSRIARGFSFGDGMGFAAEARVQ
jgi:hypothetical protein